LLKKKKKKIDLLESSMYDIDITHFKISEPSETNS
jgi:hypothetical protein